MDEARPPRVLQKIRLQKGTAVSGNLIRRILLHSAPAPRRCEDNTLYCYAVVLANSRQFCRQLVACCNVS